jgi:GT2 family glycosyltransferase
MPGAPLVSVIIVSYNTCEITLRCLRELYSAMACPAEVIVVDNASTDSSAQTISRDFPEVLIIRNDRNVGFSSANNQGMRAAKGTYFLLLNSDAFVVQGTVETLVAFLEKHPEAGVAGPRLLNADGTLQRSCHRFPTPGMAWIENLWISKLLPNHPKFDSYSRWDHNKERYVDFISGACMMVRRTTYEHVGGFDEMFFMYAEETDWQRRMHTRGWLVGFTPETKVVHLGGASGGATGIRRHVFESLDRYQYKHHGLSGLLSLRLAMVVGNALRAPIWAAILIIAPSRRRQAAAKLRLALWLLLRQTTHWHGMLGR